MLMAMVIEDQVLNCRRLSTGFENSDQPGDTALPDCGAPGILDRGDMLLPKPERQPVERCSCVRAIIERLRQVGRLGDGPRRFIDLDIDLDDIAFADSGCRAMCGTDPDQPLPAHRGHPTAPSVAVDRNRDRRPSLRPERLHDVIGDFDAGGVSGRDDLGHEFHEVEPNIRSFELETFPTRKWPGSHLHRPDFDSAVARIGDALGDPDGGLGILGLDQEEAANALVGLDMRSV